MKRRYLTILGLVPILTALLVGGISSAAPAPTASAPAHTLLCAWSETPLSPDYDAATRKDKQFNAEFRHCFTTINGVQMHYVIGGHGPQTMVLLHGFPESWYEFRDVMPALLPGRTVIAIDLPGLGDSTGYPSDETKKTLSTYVHLLLDHIGKTTGVEFVAHDFGVGVAYALAAQYRTQASGLFLMDYPLTGPTLPATEISQLAWYFALFNQQPLADDLIGHDTHEFLSLFYQNLAHGAQPMSPTAVNEYTRVYSRPQVLHVGLSLYRGVFAQDQIDDTQFEKTPLTIPVHFLAEDGLLSALFPGIQATTPKAVGEQVAGAGHWIPEEDPQLVIKDVNQFPS